MSKHKRYTSKKRGKAMSQRIKKLEEEMEPLLKTFEQRFVDNDPSLQGDQAVSTGGLMLQFGKMAPTTNANDYVYPPGSAQDFIPQNLRIGDKITVKSYKIRGQVKCALGTAAGDSNNQVRLMAVLFPDWGSITGLATAAFLLQTVLQSTTAGSASTPASSAIYSPYKARVDQNPQGNQIGMTKYRVLYDRKFNLVNTISAFTGGTGSGGSSSKESWRHDFEINLKFKKGLVCQYDGGTAVLDPAINNIVLLAVSDSSVATHPTISFVSRMKYIDA